MNRTVRTALLGAAGSLLLAGLGAGTAHADRQPLQCGTVVTASVRLAADLVDCPGSALIVGASGITIDLGGHTLDGSLVAAGIDNNGAHDDVTIRRGTIRGFAQGIDILEGSGVTVKDVTLEQNLVGMTLGRTQGTAVLRVIARDNAAAGLEGFATEDLLVQASTFTGNDHGGLVDRASFGTRLERNVFSGNEFYGAVLDISTDAVVVGNVAAANAYDGFHLAFDTGTATLTNNRAVGNGANGFVIDEAGNTLRRNTAVDNGGVGILAPAGTVDGGGNRAAGNTGGDCVTLACRA